LVEFGVEALTNSGPMSLAAWSITGCTAARIFCSSAGGISVTVMPLSCSSLTTTEASRSSSARSKARVSSATFCTIRRWSALSAFHHFFEPIKATGV